MFPRKVFMPFVVLGDPNVETSLKIIKTLVDNGAGALELGFAFSDPIADGPVIQVADKRALEAGITTEKVFLLLADVRDYTSIPISLMLSYNLMLQHGVDEFYSRCSTLKVDAVLVPDAPLEESLEIVTSSRKHNVANVSIVSPTTSDARMLELSKITTGYVYVVSLLGTTGVRSFVHKGVKPLVERVKKNFNLPVYVGFGISNPGHVREVLSYADGVITGSAFCTIIGSGLDKEEFLHKLGKFCKEMSS